MGTKLQKNRGFIKLIVIFILIIATLSYFKIDISAVIESPPVQAIWSFIQTLWANFISPLVTYVWDNILRDFIFENVVDFFQQAEEQIADKNIDSIIDTPATQ